MSECAVSVRQPQPLLSREAAVAAARAWIGTPYRLGQRCRGAGCDCATLLAAYLVEIGAASNDDLAELGLYHHDWFCHLSSERYLLRVMRHAHKTAEGICRPGMAAQPGDLCLFRAVRSKICNHGAIVTAWPFGVHAAQPAVEEVNLITHWLTGYARLEIFSTWAPLQAASGASDGRPWSNGSQAGSNQ